MRARVLLLAAAVALCAAVIVVYFARGAPEPEATAAPSPTATPTPTPTPTPTFPLAKPFDVVAEDPLFRNMDNSWMFPVDPDDPDEGAAEQAAQDAVSAVATFLNAQFVDAATRFSDGPLEALLTPDAYEALDDEARQALGALPIEFEYTETGAAVATPHVLLKGSSVYAVTVEFQADLTLISADGQAPVTQLGALLLVPTDSGWRVAGLEVTLDTPGGPRSGAAATELPEPSDTQTEASQ